LFRNYGVFMTNEQLLKENKELKLLLQQKVILESDDLYRDYFESNLLGMAKTSLEKGWIHVNEKLYKMLGYSREELFKLSWDDLTYPDDLEKDVKQFNLVLDGKIDDYHLQKRFLKKSGDIIYTKLYVKCIRNNDRSVNHFIALIEDISELKRVEEELKFLASVDPMTKLYNRRYFIDISREILDLANRNKTDTSVMMLDIDKFKNINDTYGHSVGDDVIIKIASLLKKSSRESDIICRWGGEEFIILLPQTNINGAVAISQKIREKIENSTITLSENKSLKFTISIGVSQLICEDENVEMLINRADKALYEAKESGRNKVCTN